MDVAWFKKQQKIAGVTADEIAARAGRNRSAVSHIYSGQRRMSLEWAQAFADVLKVPLDEVLRRAGALEEPKARALRPGFSDSDAAPWTGPAEGERDVPTLARLLGGGRAGVDVWEVRSRAMALAGYLPGDKMLVDTHQSERARAGDVVIAQIYNMKTGTAATVLRRFEPPVLVAASVEPDDQRVSVVDGNNVAIMGKVTASWRTS